MIAAPDYLSEPTFPGFTATVAGIELTVRPGPPHLARCLTSRRYGIDLDTGTVWVDRRLPEADAWLHAAAGLRAAAHQLGLSDPYRNL